MKKKIRLIGVVSLMALALTGFTSCGDDDDDDKKDGNGNFSSNIQTEGDYLGLYYLCEEISESTSYEEDNYDEKYSQSESKNDLYKVIKTDGKYLFISLSRHNNGNDISGELMNETCFYIVADKLLTDKEYVVYENKYDDGEKKLSIIKINGKDSFSWIYDRRYSNKDYYIETYVYKRIE